MNKKLFLSISLLTASFACAENSFSKFYNFLNQENKIPACVKDAASKTMNVVSARAVSAQAWLNEEDKLPTAVTETIAQAPEAIATGLEKTKNTLNSVEHRLQPYADKAFASAVYAANAVKTSTWDRSITLRGTEYKDAGKYMTTGTGLIIATGLAYKYGIFGKMKSAAQSAYATIKTFRPFAQKATESKKNDEISTSEFQNDESAIIDSETTQPTVTQLTVDQTSVTSVNSVEKPQIVNSPKPAVNTKPAVNPKAKATKTPAQQRCAARYKTMKKRA